MTVQSTGWKDLLVGPPGAGVPVNTRSALSIPTVFAAVTRVANDLSSLPLPVYRLVDGRPVKLPDHPVFKLFSERPNSIQTPKAYRTSMALDILTAGEHWAEVQRSEAGIPVALHRIDPSAVVTNWIQVGDEYQLEHRVNGQVIPADRLFHVLGFSLDGLRGTSPFRVCQDSLSLTLALDGYGSGFVKNGARPGGILTVPLGTTDEDRDAAFARWNEAHAGNVNAGKTVALPDGFEFRPLSASMEDSQFHESRVHQMRESQKVCGTPPHISHDYERQTWNNLQYARMEYVQGSIRPVCDAVEQAVTRLINQPGVWAEHTIEGLLRGSFSEQVATLSQAIGSGIFTVNEARALFNLPPVEVEQPKPEPTPSPTSAEVTNAA